LFFQYTLAEVNQGEWTMWQCYNYTVDEHPHVWRVLDMKPASTPDMSIYASSTTGNGRQNGGAQQPPNGQPGAGGGAGGGGGGGGAGGGNGGPPPALRVCEAPGCGLPRNWHPGRRMVVNGNGIGTIQNPPNRPGPYQGGGGGGGGAGGKGKGKGKKGKGKGRGGKGGKGKGGLPAHMVGKALKMPASAEWQQGQPVCFDAHHPDGSRCSLGGCCWTSHRCPAFKADGSIWGENHSLSAHH
jgi:hypothetical protein